MNYTNKTVIEEHDDIMIYGNDDINPIIVIKGHEIHCFGIEDHYDKTPSEDLKHVKVFMINR